MEISRIYAIAAGGLFVAAVLTNCLMRLGGTLHHLILPSALKHLVYPFLIRRRRLVGPCTRSSALLQVIYWGLAGLGSIYDVHSWSDFGTRTGILSLVNMVLLYPGFHLTFLGDVLGTRLPTVQWLHGSVALMSWLMALLHVVIHATQGRWSQVGSASQIYGLVVSNRAFGDNNVKLTMTHAIASATSVMVLSLRLFRQPLYEAFLRLHQALAILLLYAIWRHVRSADFSTRLYCYIAAALLTASVLLQSLHVLYRNVSLTQAGSMASLTKLRSKKGNDMLFMDITIARPWKVRAGQYVNLWLPSFSLRSSLQSHPFMIVYWTEGASPSLYFLIEVQGGLTRKLFERAFEVDSFYLDPGEDRQIPQKHFYRTWFSGPHGSTPSVGKYGSVLMIATGIGIAAQLPYLKELISGFNHCSVVTRRIHLVWQVGRIGDESAAVGIINKMLEDDVKDKGYIFRISIYFEFEDQTNGGLHGKAGTSGRVFYHKGGMNLSSLLSASMLGTCGESSDENSLDEIKHSAPAVDREADPQTLAEKGSKELPNRAPPARLARTKVMSTTETGERSLNRATQQQGRDAGSLLVTVSATHAVRDDVRSLVTRNVSQNVRLMELEYQPAGEESSWRRLWDKV